jgi:hypothetical protein
MPLALWQYRGPEKSIIPIERKLIRSMCKDPLIALKDLHFFNTINNSSKAWLCYWSHWYLSRVISFGQKKENTFFFWVLQTGKKQTWDALASPVDRYRRTKFPTQLVGRFFFCDSLAGWLNRKWLVRQVKPDYRKCLISRQLKPNQQHNPARHPDISPFQPMHSG